MEAAISFDLTSVLFDGDVRPYNVKWGNDALGDVSGEITWSMNLAGLGYDTNLYSLADFEEQIHLAFAAWEAIAGLTFAFLTDGATADIEIKVDPLSGTTVGEAFSQYTISGPYTGVATIFEVDITMDEDVTWVPAADNPQLSFFSVVAHEIGHGLGLDHVGDASELLHPIATVGSNLLGDGDVTGMQILYGEKRYSDSSETADFSNVADGQTVYAQGGADILNGSEDGDTFYGGEGDDELYGNGGDDFILDTRGDNTVTGGANNDTIVGGGGTLNAQGNAGNDTIIGGIGNDVIDGGDGDDTLRGDPGGSFISGDDRLIAGAGDDWMEGGGGADTFVFDLANGENRIGTLDLSGGRSITGGDFEVGFDLIELVGFSVDQGTLETADGNTIFTYLQDGFDFTIIVEDATLTTSDFF